MACKYIYKGITYNSKEEFISQVINPQFLPNQRVRRVMELQSDLFQKGRDKEDLITSFGRKYEIAEMADDDFSVYEGDEFITTFKTKNEADRFLKEKEGVDKIKTSENQFLQLLNKDNNWVTFFLKAIIQDSAKKGYEKVLFPKGDTAAKIEGHITLEEFKEQKKARIKELEKDLELRNNYDNIILPINIKEIDTGNEFLDIKYIKIDGKWYTSTEGDVNKNKEHSIEFITDFYRDKITGNYDAIDSKQYIKDKESINNEINQLKQELADVESGKTQLSSIAKFYEKTITDILKKQGYNPTEITDEYGNKWNEVTIKPENKRSFLFSREESTNESQKEESQFTDAKFEGDNYKAFLEFKKEQLEKLQNQYNRLDFQISNTTFLSETDTKTKKKKLKELGSEISKTKRHIAELQVNPNQYIYHAIEEDLYNIKDALEIENNQGQKDIDYSKIKDKLEYYQKFTQDLLQDVIGDNTKLKELNGESSRLIGLAEKKTIEFVINKINEDSFIREMVEEAKEKGENPDLFYIEPGKDITVFEQYFMGISSDRTDVTILPSYILKYWMETLKDKENNIHRLNNLLKELVEKNPELEKPDWIRQRDESGNLTGYLLSRFSPKYYEKNYSYIEELRKFNKEPGYILGNNVLKKLLKNNVLIDFTKIRAVRDIYEETYPEYFKYSEEIIDAYENNVKGLLGESYGDAIEKILRNLKNFEDSKKTVKNSKELAAQDIWKLNNTVNNLKKQDVAIKTKNGEEIVFNNFDSLVYLPRTKYVSGEDAGKPTEFYDETYIDVEKDSTKFKYYNIIKELVGYISSTYDSDAMGRLDYPKVQQEYADRIIASFKDKNLKGILNIGKETAHEFKSWFYSSTIDLSKMEKDTVRSNQSDTFRKNVKDLADLYHYKEGFSKKEAYTKAQNELANEFDISSFNSSIIAVAMEAAVHSARVEAQPEIRAMINMLNNLAEEKIGKGSDNRLKTKMEGFYNTIILNTNASKDINKFENKPFKQGILHKILELFYWAMKNENPKLAATKKLKLLSDTEKKLFDQYIATSEKGISDRDFKFDFEENKYSTYFSKKEGRKYKKNNDDITKEEFDKAVEKSFYNKAMSLGLDRSIAGFVDAVIKFNIFKSMALNPISGAFNRAEAKNSGLIMDAKGEYWTEGNYVRADNLMSFANLTEMSNNKLKLIGKDRVETMKIFKSLMDQFNIFQDRKNELQKTVEESSMSRKLYNPFIWAVDNPEFKNQGSVMMCVMMDTMLEDSNGNKVPLLDRNTGKFNMEFIKDGKLQVSKEQMGALVSKMATVVAHTQGDYSANDIMLAKQNIWGRAGTMYMRWFPQMWDQRFGISGKHKYDALTGKKRRDGRYIEAWRTNKVNTTLTAALYGGISFGFTPLFLGAMGASTLGIYMYNKYMKDHINSKDNMDREYNTVKELISFAKSVVIDSLNYPVQFLAKKTLIDNKTFTYLSEKDRQAMRALSKELGMVLTMFGAKVLAGMVMFDDEEDKESPSRMRYNFVQNQFSKVINSLNMYSNPYQLISDNSRIAFLATLQDAAEVSFNAYKMDRDKFSKNVWNVLPVPRILHKGSMPYEDKMNYDTMPSFSGIDSPMKWIDNLIQDVKTDGLRSAKMKYEKEYRLYRERIKNEIIDKGITEKSKVNKEIAKQMKKNLKMYGESTPKNPEKLKQFYIDKLKDLKQVN